VIEFQSSAPEQFGRTLSSSTFNSRSLALARVAIGISAALTATILAVTAPVALVAEPYFPVIGDLGLRPMLAPVTVLVLIGALAVFGLLLAVGPNARVSATAVCTAGTVLLLSDARLYSNHLLLLVLLSAGLVVAGGGRFGDSASRSAPTGAILLCTQVSFVYLFAGLSKLNPMFLSGAVLREELPPDLIAAMGFLATPGLRSASIAAIGVEITLAFLLWNQRWRRPAALLGAAFHTTIVALMAPTFDLVVFALLCVGMYPLFLTRMSDDPSGVPVAYRREGRFDLV
jgi:hypothetical protein